MKTLTAATSELTDDSIRSVVKQLRSSNTPLNAINDHSLGRLYYDTQDMPTLVYAEIPLWIVLARGTELRTVIQERKLLN